jgi:hypothetical protein
MRRATIMGRLARWMEGDGKLHVEDVWWVHKQYPATESDRGKVRREGGSFLG